MFGVFGNRADCVCFARNGVAQVTAVDFAEVQVMSGSHAGEEAVQYFVGIASSEVDVTTGMSSFQSFHFYFEEEISGGNFNLFISKLCNGIDTSGASDKDLSFIFRVEIKQDVTTHETFFQGESSSESGFLVYGKQAFQRTVLNAIVGQNSQFGGYADTVVGSKGGTFRFQPFTVNFCFNGVGEEVVLNVVVLFTHHVDMRLQYDSLQVFFSRSSGFLDKYVTGFVHFGFQVMFCSECLQVGNHFFFLLRRAGHLADFFEILEYAGRLQIFFFHAVSIL